MSVGDIRARLFAVAPARELVDVPEAGVTIEVRSLTAGGRGRVMNAAQGADGGVDYSRYYAALVLATAHDPDTGQPVFSEGDFDAVNALPAGVVARLASAAERLANLDQSVTELGNGSAATPSAATDSGSPNDLA